MIIKGRKILFYILFRTTHYIYNLPFLYFIFELPPRSSLRMKKPPAILDLVCETFLKRNVSAILFLSNAELYGRNTAAAQYFLQLTNYLRIPVIAWNADNSGLEKVFVTWYLNVLNEFF